MPFCSIHDSSGVEVSELNGTNTFLIMVDHSRMARDFLGFPCVVFRNQGFALNTEEPNLLGTPAAWMCSL